MDRSNGYAFPRYPAAHSGVDPERGSDKLIVKAHYSVRRQTIGVRPIAAGSENAGILRRRRPLEGGF
jgi:hypothetical protein